MFAGCFPDSGLINVGKDDLATVDGKPIGDCLPDSPGRSRNESNFPRQIALHGDL
jgi:hypothetical protein